MKFIDLYAGLVGFQKGLTRIGHECARAGDYIENLRRLYKANYPRTPIEVYFQSGYKSNS